MSADPCGSLCILPLSGALALHAAAEPSFIRKRNERERDRVRCVNEGYARLKRHLPNGARQKRLSKVDTLKEAITYIRHLQTLLTHNTPPPPSPPPSHHHHYPHHPHTSEARFELRSSDCKENVCPAPAVVGGGERDEGRYASSVWSEQASALDDGTVLSASDSDDELAQCVQRQRVC